MWPAAAQDFERLWTLLVSTFPLLSVCCTGGGLTHADQDFPWPTPRCAVAVRSVCCAGGGLTHADQDLPWPTPRCWLLLL